eukprot:jgi/Chrzof1/1489/Cz10g09220.t1
MVPVKLAKLKDETRCPICYGKIRNARVSMVCLHRYCATCIEQYLRAKLPGRPAEGKECPVCRAHLHSRRATKVDPSFDRLITALYGNVEKYDTEEDRLIAEDNKRYSETWQTQLAKIREMQAQRAAAAPPRPGRPPNRPVLVEATTAKSESSSDHTGHGQGIGKHAAAAKAAAVAGSSKQQPQTSTAVSPFTAASASAGMKRPRSVDIPETAAVAAAGIPGSPVRRVAVIQPGTGNLIPAYAGRTNSKVVGPDKPGQLTSANRPSELNPAGSSHGSEGMLPPRMTAKATAPIAMAAGAPASNKHHLQQQPKQEQHTQQQQQQPRHAHPLWMSADGAPRQMGSGRIRADLEEARRLLAASIHAAAGQPHFDRCCVVELRPAQQQQQQQQHGQPAHRGVIPVQDLCPPAQGHADHGNPDGVKQEVADGPVATAAVETKAGAAHGDLHRVHKPEQQDSRQQHAAPQPQQAPVSQPNMHWTLAMPFLTCPVDSTMAAVRQLLQQQLQPPLQLDEDGWPDLTVSHITLRLAAENVHVGKVHHHDHDHHHHHCDDLGGGALGGGLALNDNVTIGELFKQSTASCMHLLLEYAVQM